MLKGDNHHLLFAITPPVKPDLCVVRIWASKDRRAFKTAIEYY